jgi:hypothetical protein
MRVASGTVKNVRAAALTRQDKWIWWWDGVVTGERPCDLCVYMRVYLRQVARRCTCKPVRRCAPTGRGPGTEATVEAEDVFAHIFDGEQVLEVSDSEYYKVDGDSDTRRKYDEI